MKNEKKKLAIATIAEREALLPVYGSKGAAGADIRANIKEDILLGAGQRLLVPTGLRFEIPEGYEIQVRPRSGLALKEGITVLNTPGTIDSDYRGELKVILINHGLEDYLIKVDMRIAQIVVSPVMQVDFNLTEDLCETLRGSSGFGHTGTH